MSRTVLPAPQRLEDLFKGFHLENAAEVLGQAFEHGEIIPSDSRMEVTNFRPLVEYILNLTSFGRYSVVQPGL